MDIIASKQAVEFARKWTVDEEKGPLLLEFVTYRYGGHSYVVFPPLPISVFRHHPRDVSP